MKNNTQKLAVRSSLGALLLLAAPLGMAACEEPAFTLDIPDGKSASQAEMAEVQQALNDFISKGESFIACVEKEETRNRAAQMSNAMLSDMEKLAAQFNRQLRYFRRNNS